MPHHCPIPVRSTDSRCCYQTGSAPLFTLCLAVLAALSCYAGFGRAAPSAAPQMAAISSMAPALDNEGGAPPAD